MSVEAEWMVVRVGSGGGQGEEVIVGGNKGMGEWNGVMKGGLVLDDRMIDDGGRWKGFFYLCFFTVFDKLPR